MHSESERAKAWSQIYSEETLNQSIPVITSWQLNERMWVSWMIYMSIDIFLVKLYFNQSLTFLRYGELQGLNKQQTADKFGKEQVHEWRRSYDIPPPNGESLEMCAERAVAYFKEHVSILLVLCVPHSHHTTCNHIYKYISLLTPD